MTASFGVAEYAGESNSEQLVAAAETLGPGETRRKDRVERAEPATS